MEKPATKSKNKLWKAVQAAVLFQNLPFSPRGDNRADVIAHRHKTHHSKGFAGPIVPMIPAEARRKPRTFESQEPTSPKVSCMGQIKQKKASLPKQSNPDKSIQTRPKGPNPETTKKKQSGIKKIFRAGMKSDVQIDGAKPSVPGAEPSLSQIRKFASSRDTFANFDWTASQIAPADDREYYSDGERVYRDGEDDIIIRFSASKLVAGGGGVAGLGLEPRKEINLWKRRTAAQPRPLQLNIDKEI